MLTHEEQQKILGNILKRKDNLYCAQCGGKSPCWASLDFGVFVCLNCSGGHRALGPSVTRVKSTRLDSWNREWLNCVQIGNTTLNSYWQYEITDAQQKKLKPNENSSVQFISRFIRDKYVKKLYSHPYDTLQEFIKKNKPLPPSPKKPQVKQDNHKYKLHKMHKAQTIIGDIPSDKQIQKVKADFSFFDQMTIPKKEIKPDSNHNLIGLDDEKPQRSALKKATSSFADFDLLIATKSKQQKKEPLKPKQQKQKYNKQQFMSLGGLNPNKPKPKPTIDFDTFHHHAQKKQNTNLLNFQNNQNKNKYSTNMQFQQYGFNQVSQNQCYNKNNFSTISGGYQFSQSGQNQGGNKIGFIGQDGVYGFQNTWGGAPLNSQKNKVQNNLSQKGANNQAISLQPTINFDKLQKDGIKLQTPARSWVDDWK